MGNEEDERSAAGRGRIREVLDSVQSEVTISRVWDESPSVSSRGFQPRTQSHPFLWAGKLMAGKLMVDRHGWTGRIVQANPRVVARRVCRLSPPVITTPGSAKALPESFARGRRQ